MLGVEMMYEIKKHYCPKYQIHFYIEEPAEAKIVRMVFPISLIAMLSTLNVINGTTLDNSINLSPTLVFLLPQLKPTGFVYAAEGLSGNNLLITLLFLGH